MENVYAPENFSATEPLDLKKYFKEFQAESKIQELNSNNLIKERFRILKEEFKLPLNLDDVKALEDLCTIEKLKLSNENPKLPLQTVPRDHEISVVHPLTNEVKILETVKCKEIFNIMKNDISTELKSMGIGCESSKCDANDVKDLKPGSTFIHKVIVHTPFNTLLGNRLTPDSIKVQYEIEVLGTNTLMDLANAIKCVSDVFIIKEVPDTQVDLSTFFNAKEEYPSRCFFIENVFYNDMSCPNATDYSTVVKKWATENKIGEFRSESMEGVTFEAIKPRLGFGYVYIHQGNCEHVINFSDARLLQSNDCLVSSKYPRIILMKRQSGHLCFICSENHASWMIVNSDRLPLKKVFFCTKCCESYMFFEGKKIGRFQLYPYNNGILPPPTLMDRGEPDENDWGYVDETS